MDSSRTRFLLRAMRPNGADHDDPTFSAALEQTHADPELRAWFEREQAVDRALVSKLREVRAPADLRAHILQGVALSRPGIESKRSMRWWRHAPMVRAGPVALFTAALAAAASIALVIYTLLPTRAPRASFDLIVTAAVRETAEPPALALQTNSRAEIAAWLQNSAVPIPDTLPGQLATQDVLGCNVTEWQGVRCSLLTLRAPGLAPDASAGAAANPAARADPTLVHVYTVPRNSCSSQGVGLTPQIASREGATVATWRDAERYYVLVTRASPASVQALLGPEARIAWQEAPDETLTRSATEPTRHRLRAELRTVL
jgi:hypothetical protein